MECVDVIVVGAGVIGCFTARALSAYCLDTVVLEQREDVCTGISRANTGIIYSGCDTKQGTLKTELCVRNSLAFPQLCEELDVPFQQCGSLMVCSGETGRQVLREKYDQGLRNGAPGIKLLSREEVLKLEPGLSDHIKGALFSPTTGVVDPWALCIAAFENARDNGVRFCLSERLVRMERSADSFLVETEKKQYLARAVVNCAGLQSAAIREIIESPAIRIFPSGADYLVLDRNAAGCPSHVVFQETENGKGVTLVPTVTGNLLIGPTDRISEDDSFSTTEFGLQKLYSFANEVMPELPLEQAIRHFGALRPNPYWVKQQGNAWVRNGKGISNFTIFDENGLVSFIGIKTPGLTCAQGLGEYAAEKVRAFLKCDSLNPHFSPHRTGISCVRRMEESERAELVRRNPDYGEIVCMCNEITKGEVIDAIRRGATTVDGIKRRIGVTMGRCQGNRCLQPVLESLSQTLQCPSESVTKDGKDSYILL